MAKAKAKLKKKLPKKAVKEVSKKNVKKSAKKSAKKPVKISAKKVVPKKSAPVKTKKLDVSVFVTPLDDRIIVQAFAAERVTPGGLIIPDTVNQTVGYNQGLVLSVGRGHRDNKGRLRPMDVKPGDKILFSQLASSTLKYENAELFIIRETEVMGVIS